MQPKESKSSKHFKLSMIKSGLRLYGCFCLAYQDFVVGSIFLALAEILGIAEEF